MLAAALLSAACHDAPAPHEAAEGMDELEQLDPAEPDPAPAAFEPIPNCEMTTQDGQKVHFYDDLVRGRIVVVQFFFVHCEGICPVSTGKMLALQEELRPRLGHDLFFLSITLDPERDTPEVLKEHATEIGAAPGWTFLTGKKEDIEALRYRLGVFDRDPVIDADRNQHAGVLVLGNDPKQRWMMKPALLSTSAMLRTIRLLSDSPSVIPVASGAVEKQS